ncbi:MAG: hypothetical protein QNJ00_13525 [Woeseiaceae bacterium]|nr:hypothetical protein [Woeseiaceae bacterium]
METLIAITVFMTLIALFMLFNVFRHLRRGRMLRAGGSFAGGVATGSLGGAGAVMVISLYGYAQLTGEQDVAMIEFAEVDDDRYTARLMIDGTRDRFFELAGDEWQIDAKLVTWTPPATILGLEPIYQLDRLSGRYGDIEREQSEARTVYALSEDVPVDVFEVAQRFPVLMPGVDAYYGTATFVPMADGARFQVSLSRDALIARPLNDAARRAVGEWQQNGT